jgi:spore germination cell wall hydrolase CwlJ-like protein
VPLELRLVAVLTAFLVTPALNASGMAPVIRLTDPFAPPEEPTAPLLSFSIPKYTLPAPDRELIATCLVREAASQGDFGMRCVMAVIRNRAGDRVELFAPTVLKAKQFSALNLLTAGRETTAQAIARAQRDRMWDTALAIVDDATKADWRDPTRGATHYTRSVERTPWTRSLAKTVTVGAHSFYR